MLRFKAAHTDFGFHGWVTLQTAHRHEVHEVERKFAKFGNLALDKDGYFIRIESGRQVIECYLNHVLTNLFGVFDVVGECLCIGDEHKHFLKSPSFCNSTRRFSEPT